MSETVFTIITDYLREHGFDGLYNEAGECACELALLVPCEALNAECSPGIKTTCDCGDHDWHISKRENDH